MENETEDEILARALEESLRHYREVELPRLSQAENQTSCNSDVEELEAGGWDCWDEWDEEQVVNAVHVGEAIENGGVSADPQTSNWQPEKKKCSNSIDVYIHKEVLPRKSVVSVGEVGDDGADGFDKEAGRTWIYPCNYPVRKYQLDIVHSALFDNTLVSLPTGLGKTFIAAVVMYNFYRWFPRGKIIFLAPTRPLVAQQIHACYDIMGIPPEDTAELTGSKVGVHRAVAWKEKRVFFATPQVFANDLGTGLCPGELVRCVVVDEAHRAAGNHAICQSFRSLFRLREQYPMSRFRVVALSATPGKNPNAVVGVVSALQLSKLELRDDLSPDVAPYTHRRNLETVVVPLGPELTETRDKLMVILDVFLDRLIRRNLIYCKDKSKLSRFQLLLARDNFRKNAQSMNYSEKSLVEGDFATCMSLVHAMGLLLTHGERTFMSFVQAILSGDKGYAVVKNRLSNNIPLLTLLQHLQEKLGQTMPQPAPNASQSQGMAAELQGDQNGNSFITSHPKMDHLRDIVVKHFENFQATGESTRVMIFCEFRDPVMEICNMLMQHWPLIKPMSFVGQASSTVQVDADMPGPTRGTKGFTQKQQLQVIRRFREGGYNVLVSTCVGEEGLDIGEVDLIVCYDAPHASPLRLVQRMGRTGRKREGRVVTLVTKEIEEQKHRQGLRQKGMMLKSLLSSKVLETSLCRNNARVLPPDAKPSCHMMPMTIPKLLEEGKKKGKKSKAKSGKTITVEDMLNQRTGKDVEENEVNESDAKETLSKKSKGKGKGKSSKSISKVKPRKGIKEFFSVQKAMVVDTIVLSDEEAEDDDFVGAGVSKVKSKFDECEDGDEIIAMEEDMASPPRSPSSPLIEALSPFKVNCQASPHEVLQISSKVQPVLSDVSAIPCDLLALENTLSVLFVSICCNDSEVDSPYRCSVIKSHFQIRHPVHYSHNMSSNFEIDSITVDALKSFDPEKEAKNIGKWCPKPAITECKNADHSLTRNYGVSSEKNDLFAWNTRSDTTLTSKRHTTLVKNKKNFVQEECNKSKGIDIKISNEIRDLEVIDVFDSDEEMACYPTSTKKKPSKTPVDVAATAGEGLLWNVLGRKECRTERVAEINDIGITSDGIVLKKDFFDSKKASCNTLCDKDNLKKREDTSGCDRNSGKIDEVKKFNPPNCSDKILNSPDIIEDGYFGLQERTPTKGSPGVMNVSKDQSYSNADILGQPVLASSTPKVHRKNLFSPKSHLPSPISHHRKKSPGTFEILPAKDNFSESEQHFPYHSRARSPSCLPSGIKKLEKWGRVTTESIEYPKFTLGSEYEFSSSDETIFEPEGDLNLGEANFNSIEIQNSAGKRDIGKALFVGDNSSNKYLQPEQIPGILPHKVEKSSDLFEMTSADASKSMSVKNKHSNVHNGTCDDVYDHSFTITQAVNMLACAKNRPCRREEEDLTDRKEVKLEDQNETLVYHKNTGPHSEGRSLLTNGKSVKKEEVISLKVKEKSLPVNKNVTCLSKESTEEVANVDQVKAADEEINFDIGEDILLDLSADLFAEDNADGDENSDVEPEVGKLGQFLSETKTSAVTTGEEMKPKKVPASIISDEVMKGAEKEVHMKSQSFGNENCVSQPRGKLQRPTVSNNNENLTGKTRDEFSIPAPVISGWSANGWLSKGSHSSKSKFSLGLKGIKQHMESEGPSMKMDVNKSTDLKTNNLVSDKVAFRSSTSVLSTRRDNQINCETSERTILDAINDLEKKHLCKSPEVNPGKKGISIPSDDSLTCLDFQDIDFVENGADCQLESSFDVQHKHAREESKNVTVRGQKRSKEVDVEVIKVATVQPCVRNSREYKEKSLDKSDLVEHQRKNSSKEFVVDLECDLSDWEVHPEDGHNSGGRNGESSDDDFVGHGTSVSRDKQRSINGQNTTNSSEERAPVKTRRIRRKKNRVFLDTQAEESFVETHGAGSDEEEDDDDVRGLSQYYDPSFINDAGPNSQETEVDMHAKYLQSVRSPRNAKFKIPNCKLLEPHNESEVESEEQSYHQDEPDSCYMNDSFCVDSNSDEKEESVDELEVLEAILANSKKGKNFKRRKKENGGTSSDEPLETAVVTKARKVENSDVGHRKKRKRKRIVVHDSSDEEERDSHSLSKKNCKVDEEIAVVDEKLWDEFSQDFVEEPLETNQKCSSTNESSPDPRREVPSLSKPVNAPTSSHKSPLVTAGGESKTSDELREVLIIVSPMEACRSSEVMSALRVIKGVRLVVYAASGSPSIPYCLGRDLCLLRASSSGLGRNSKMPDAVQAALNLFHKVALIIEWEKESDGATSSWMKKKSNPNSNSESVPANYGTSEYVALLNLRSAGVNVLHSYGLVETAKLIADIARHQQGLEMQANMPPPSLPSSFQSSNPALKFYASLPGLNTFQAFSLFLQFPKINDFLLRCKSARSIQMATYLDLNKSLHLQQILANVHFSDT
ncbi:uncharacterized protein LOC124165234 isoform X2 [Ischnura elegans]|uniref:uncharacterized protein LOC124165234 isoform X2 n=1 Tax=Ischnura elegans TaxID=197161 RepID=UPI001ED872E8|nr:uncharacterized protein LOC124165234 isoform X2 [Ischnura elegans]